MPDIAMCLNKSCPQRETCYRFKAPPDFMQAYGAFKPDVLGDCERYWAISKSEARRYEALREHLKEQERVLGVPRTEGDGAETA